MYALAMEGSFGRARVNGDKVDRNKGKISRDHWIRATIHSPLGKQIGMLPVPSQFLNGKPERAGEFVLLFSNGEKQSDGEGKERTNGADRGGFEHVKRVQTYSESKHYADSMGQGCRVPAELR